MSARCESRAEGERCDRAATTEIAPASYYGAQPWAACAEHAREARASGATGAPLAATRYEVATDLRAGDVVLDEDGEEKLVTFAIVEGERAHLVVGGASLVLTSDDVVEVVEA